MKWNSNSGWINRREGDADEFMQALSHFSYHMSGGELLMCDLQGIVLEYEADYDLNTFEQKPRRENPHGSDRSEVLAG